MTDDIAPRAHGSCVQGVWLTDDGRLALSQDGRGVVRGWEADTGAPLGIASAEDLTSRPARSRDQRHVAEWTRDGLAVRPARGGIARVLTPAWSGHRVGPAWSGPDLVVAIGRTLLRLDRVGRVQALETLRADPWVLAADGRRVLIGFVDGSVEGRSSRLGPTWRQPGGRAIRALACGPDGVVAVHADGAVRAHDGKVWIDAVRGPFGDAIALGPDARLVASATDAGLLLWDRATARTIRELALCGRVPRHVAFGGGRIAVGSRRTGGGALDVWDVASGAHEVRESGRFAPRVALTADGACLAVAWDWDGDLELRDLATGGREPHFVGDGGVTALSFSRNGRWLGVGTLGLAVHRLDRRTGARRRHRIEPDSVAAVAVRDDGVSVALTAYDPRVWVLTDEARVLGEHVGDGRAAVFTGDGGFATGATDGAVARW